MTPRCARTRRPIRPGTDVQLSVTPPARSNHGAGAAGPASAAGRGRGRLRHRLLECREPDPGAIGAPRRGAGRARRAWREHGRAQAHAARREPGAVRRRGGARRCDGAAVRGCRRAVCRPLLGPRARRHRRSERALDWRGTGDGRGGAARLRPASALAARILRPRAGERHGSDHVGHEPPPARLRDHADCLFVRAARRRRACSSPRSSPWRRPTPATTCGTCWSSTSHPRRPASASETRR